MHGSLTALETMRGWSGAIINVVSEVAAKRGVVATHEAIAHVVESPVGAAANQ